MRTLWIFIIMLLVIGAVTAQEPGASATDINRTNELAWIKYVRNDRMPEMQLLLMAPTFTVFNPFNPSGLETAREQAVTDEGYFQTAYTHAFTEWMVLTEGDLAGVYVYQEGDFVGEYYGVQPNGEHQAGTMLWIDRLADGHVAENYAAWDQQGFVEGLGWAAVDYPDYTVAPWGVTLGTTSSTPEDHHAVLNTLFDSFCTGCTADYAALYAEDVVAHDYNQTLEGLTAVSEQFGKLTQLSALERVDTKVVCEGDMCISYLILNFTMADEVKPLIWSAVHRFEDGKIVEEWWQYDNSVLWPALDTLQ